MDRYSREYHNLHARVRYHHGKASEYLCICGEQAREWATLHGRDGTDISEDYVPLCRKCHAAYDGLAEVISQARTGKSSGPRSESCKQKMAARQNSYWYGMTAEQRSEEFTKRRHAVKD